MTDLIEKALAFVKKEYEQITLDNGLTLYDKAKYMVENMKRFGTKVNHDGLKAAAILYPMFKVSHISPVQLRRMIHKNFGIEILSSAEVLSGVSDSRGDFPLENGNDIFRDLRDSWGAQKVFVLNHAFHVNHPVLSSNPLDKIEEVMMYLNIVRHATSRYPVAVRGIELDGIKFIAATGKILNDLLKAKNPNVNLFALMLQAKLSKTSHGDAISLARFFELKKDERIYSVDETSSSVLYHMQTLFQAASQAAAPLSAKQAAQLLSGVVNATRGKETFDISSRLMNNLLAYVVQHCEQSQVRDIVYKPLNKIDTYGIPDQLLYRIEEVVHGVEKKGRIPKHINPQIMLASDAGGTNAAYTQEKAISNSTQSLAFKVNSHPVSVEINDRVVSSKNQQEHVS